jgi:T-complex protein 1 subunit alpha
VSLPAGVCLGTSLSSPGGGAVEAGLSIYLENFATSLGSREQLAIAEFADALLVLPKTLAVNAAKVGQQDTGECGLWS